MSEGKGRNSLKLMLVHTLAYHSGLVTGGQSQVWSVTAGGGAFRQAPPPIQVVFLYSCWWAEIDWEIAFPVSGLAGGLPMVFKPEAQAALRRLPDQENVPFERFADEIIAKSGLEWPSQNQTFVESIKRNVVERVLVDAMVRFGALECQYEREKKARIEIEKLVSIRLTPVGRGPVELFAE